MSKPTKKSKKPGLNDITKKLERSLRPLHVPGLTITPSDKALTVSASIACDRTKVSIVSCAAEIASRNGLRIEKKVTPHTIEVRLAA